MTALELDADGWPLPTPAPNRPNATVARPDRSAGMHDRLAVELAWRLGWNACEQAIADRIAELPDLPPTRTRDQAIAARVAEMAAFDVPGWLAEQRRRAARVDEVSAEIGAARRPVATVDMWAWVDGLPNGPAVRARIEDERDRTRQEAA